MEGATQSVVRETLALRGTEKVRMAGGWRRFRRGQTWN